MCVRLVLAGAGNLSREYILNTIIVHLFGGAQLVKYSNGYSLGHLCLAALQLIQCIYTRCIACNNAIVYCVLLLILHLVCELDILPRNITAVLLLLWNRCVCMSEYFGLFSCTNR